MNAPVMSTKSAATTGKLKFLLVVLALLAAVITGIALGDSATAQESSEAAFIWAADYSSGWSWL